MEEVTAVVTDLMFQSRIAAAARYAGRPVRFITSSGALAAQPAAGVALVDLDAGLDVIAAIQVLKACGTHVIAFGPHLDTEGRQRARKAGADRVLAKSKFVTELPRIMNELNPGAADAASAAIAEFREYGKRMEELGRLLQDPDRVRRLYFAPDVRMETARADGEPIVLDAADYGDFLAVESLRSKLDHLRGVYGEARVGGARSGA